LASTAFAERTIPLNKKAFERLEKAKREGETFSDVVLRLTSLKLTGLQKRGEGEITTSDGRVLQVRIEEDLCLGAESCAILAPEVFSLDETELGGRKVGGQPLGLLEVEDGTVDSEKIIRAAKSCPYQAISVRDARTSEQVCP
jgi:ferredoxin